MPTPEENDLLFLTGQSNLEPDAVKPVENADQPIGIPEIDNTDATNLTPDELELFNKVNEAFAKSSYADRTPGGTKAILGPDGKPISSAPSPEPVPPAGVTDKNSFNEPVAGSEDDEGAGSTVSDDGSSVGSHGNEGALPPPPPGVDPQVTPGYTIVHEGQEYSFSHDEVRSALQLAGWSASLPDWMRQAYAGIEAGHLVAIPVDEYQALVALRENPNQQRRPQTDPGFDDFDVDDEKASKIIAALQERIAGLERAVGGFDPVGAARAAVNYDRQVQEATDLLGGVTQQFGNQYGLNPQELSELEHFTAETGIFIELSKQKNTYSPTGQVIAGDPDVPGTVREALTRALAIHPTLSNRLITNVAQQQVDQRQAEIAIVESKKRNSAPLASTSSAAVSTPPRDPNKRPTPQDVEQAIANELRTAIANGTAHL